MSVRFAALRRLARHALAARARYRDWMLRRRPHHRLAACAIFREEAPFLDEWLRFHLAVGFEHFYLYNNFSTDDYQAVLAPWIERGAVTLRDWPEPVGQLAAYRDCVARHGREAAWIAFIDIDEFLFAPGGENVPTVLEEYSGLPGLLVYGTFFGASGHDRRPSGPVLSSYTRRAGVDVACSGKTIANPRHIRAISNVHLFQYWTGETLDTSRRTHAEGQAAPVFDRLRYHHYWSRSLEDLHVKVGRGDASTPDRRDLGWHLAYEAKLNAIEDCSIIPIAARLAAGQDAGGGGEAPPATGAG